MIVQTIKICGTLVLLFGLLTACTGYHKDSVFGGGGFDETRLGENIWNITARGNAFASKKLIANLIMMRSADLAQQNGFSHFAFSSGSTDTTTSVTSSPSTTYTSGYVNPSGSFNATSNTYGGGLNFYAKPSAENTVVMFNGNPNNINGVVYEAAFVCESVGKILKSECGKIK